jgi:hypothetical protein
MAARRERTRAASAASPASTTVSAGKLLTVNPRVRPVRSSRTLPPKVMAARPRVSPITAICIECSSRRGRTRKAARAYKVDGKLTKGFALLAYPASYGTSRVMTFIVNQNGVVWQRDLGDDTPAAAAIQDSIPTTSGRRSRPKAERPHEQSGLT